MLLGWYTNLVVWKPFDLGFGDRITRAEMVAYRVPNFFSRAAEKSTYRSYLDLLWMFFYGGWSKARGCV